LLNENGVEYLLVRGVAVAMNGHREPRLHIWRFRVPHTDQHAC
jgi:hypothetical protein